MAVEPLLCSCKTDDLSRIEQGSQSPGQAFSITLSTIPTGVLGCLKNLNEFSYHCELCKPRDHFRLGLDIGINICACAAVVIGSESVQICDDNINRSGRERNTSE
jgi:hypothetical protein